MTLAASTICFAFTLPLRVWGGNRLPRCARRREASKMRTPLASRHAQVKTIIQRMQMRCFCIESPA